MDGAGKQGLAAAPELLAVTGFLWGSLLGDLWALQKESLVVGRCR